MAIVDRSGIPISLRVESASPHESQLVEGALRERHIKDLPCRLWGDKAYDSDPLEVLLQTRYRVELIAPSKSNRKKKTQDGRSLRRYKRRWRVERFFSWIQSFRRVETRYEYFSWMYLGMV